MSAKEQDHKEVQAKRSRNRMKRGSVGKAEQERDEEEQRRERGKRNGIKFQGTVPKSRIKIKKKAVE